MWPGNGHRTKVKLKRYDVALRTSRSVVSVNMVCISMVCVSVVYVSMVCVSVVYVSMACQCGVRQRGVSVW